MNDLASASVAVVGTGPAGLMAATKAAQAGCRVTLFEKRAAPGRKLLIAGSSGLNVSYDAPLDEFCKMYKDAPAGHFEKVIAAFNNEAWLRFIGDLGLTTFKGTSRRYFVRDESRAKENPKSQTVMKGAPLLRVWLSRLVELGVVLESDCECVDFKGPEVELTIRNKAGEVKQRKFGAVCLAFGGGSYEPNEAPLRWLDMFKMKGIGMRPFRASNVGYEVAWSEDFLREAEGEPLKPVIFKTNRGQLEGELVVTRYGLEGTPIYRVGEVGVAMLDLLPGLSEEGALRRCLSAQENLSPLRRVKKYLNLSPAANALVFHYTPTEAKGDLKRLVRRLKAFPLELVAPRPLEEAISSAGGVLFEEVNDSLMLQKAPGVFVAGEMLDWDAPTGGFLIQGCVSQGSWVGNAMVRYLQRH